MTGKIVPVALLVAFALSAAASAQNSAAEIYKSSCAPCHGVNGDANTPAGRKFKATAFNSPKTLKENDAQLLVITRNGKGQMPPWSDVLTDAQLKSVIGYIRGFQKKGSDHSSGE